MTLKTRINLARSLIEALEAVGVRRNMATIIVYLTDLEEATSRDIEKGSGLRQPEVSIAMNTLREKGWIAERDKKKEERGRPPKLYKLTVSIDDIIGYYTEMKRIASRLRRCSLSRSKKRHLPA